MKKRFLIAWLILPVALLGACKQDIVDRLEDGKSVTAYLYNRKDVVVDKRTVKKQSSAYTALLGWVRKNNSDWQSAPGIVTPALFVEGEGFTINISRDRAVITSKEGQYARKIPFETYDWFKQMFGLVDNTK